MSKKHLKNLAFAVGVIVFGLVVLSQFRERLFESDQASGVNISDEEHLTRIADKINQACPMPIADGIVMQNVKALPGKTLVYTTMITSVSVGDPVLTTLLGMMKEPLAEQLRTAPEFQQLREMRAKVICRFYDKDGAFIDDVVISSIDNQ